jgi:hypothetical protein
VYSLCGYPLFGLAYTTNYMPETNSIRVYDVMLATVIPVSVATNVIPVSDSSSDDSGDTLPVSDPDRGNDAIAVGWGEWQDAASLCAKERNGWSCSIDS